MCSAKYYSTTHTHPYSWSTVAAGLFKRYPNPFATHVLSEDTLFRQLQQNGQVLYTRRFLTKTNKMPKWGEPFLPSGLKRMVPLVEESFVDRHEQVIVTYTRNVGLSRFMTAVERVEYRAHPDHPDDVTVAKKEAWVESGLYGIRSAVKNFGIERFKQNCHRATDGFNLVLSQLEAQQQRVRQSVRHGTDTLKETAKHAAERAKAHSTVHAAATDNNTSATQPAPAVTGRSK